MRYIYECVIPAREITQRQLLQYNDPTIVYLHNISLPIHDLNYIVCEWLFILSTMTTHLTVHITLCTEPKRHWAINTAGRRLTPGSWQRLNRSWLTRESRLARVTRCRSLLTAHVLLMDICMYLRSDETAVLHYVDYLRYLSTYRMVGQRKYGNWACSYLLIYLHRVLVIRPFVWRAVNPTPVIWCDREGHKGIMCI